MTENLIARRRKMEYRTDDQQLDAAAFIAFVNKVWPGKYDEKKNGCRLIQNAEYNRL